MKLLGIVLGALLGLAACSEDKPTQAPADHLVDLNSASKTALIALPGIGEVTAKKIIDGRPYERKDQLVSRHIVTEEVYEKFKDAVIAKQ